jgi:hypothetical protein
MSIFFAIMFAPVALFFGFLIIRALMEPMVWLWLIGLLAFVLLLIGAPR